MLKFVIAGEVLTVLHMHLCTSGWNLEMVRIAPGSLPGFQAVDHVQGVDTTE